jgi:hypothetical protein
MFHGLMNNHALSLHEFIRPVGCFALIFLCINSVIYVYEAMMESRVAVTLSLAVVAIPPPPAMYINAAVWQIHESS